MTTRISRRALLGAAGAATLAAAGCGTSGPGSSRGNTLQLWALQSDTQNPVLKKAIDAFNSGSSVKVKMTTYVNDPYKQKLQVSMGSPNAPDIFFNWGGGNLGQFVEAKQVHDLSPMMKAHPDFGAKFLPSVLDSGKIDGRQYGVPMDGMQPNLLYYNKTVFDAAKRTPPKTYDELLDLVDVFKAKGITPIALAGSQGWTELIYLMYFTDRIGGPSAFADISAGKPGAWRAPALRQAAQHCVDLVKRGAFGSNFASVNYDNQGASKLLATGKAAMHVMGSWEYQTQLGSSPKFVKGGKLGWTAFPSVPGKGDAKNVVGVPANHFSISSACKHPKQAQEFLRTTMAANSYVSGLIKVGEIPAVKGIESKLTGDAADFTHFTYSLVSDAPSFTLAWDQALSPSVGSALNTNLQKLFGGQVDAAGFTAAMDAAK